MHLLIPASPANTSQPNFQLGSSAALMSCKAFIFVNFAADNFFTGLSGLQTVIC